MAWTTPRTWTTGEAITSAMFNTHIRDLFNFMAEEPHECWIERTSDATIANTTVTTISWQAATRNVGSLWVSGTDVTIKQEGLYAITLNSQWATATAGFSFCAIQIASTQICGYGDDAKGVNNSVQQKSCHATFECQPNDVIQGVVSQNSGGNLALQGGVTPGTNLKVVQAKRRLV